MEQQKQNNMPDWEALKNEFIAGMKADLGDLYQKHEAKILAVLDRLTATAKKYAVAPSSEVETDLKALRGHMLTLKLSLRADLSAAAVDQTMRLFSIAGLALGAMAREFLLGFSGTRA